MDFDLRAHSLLVVISGSRAYGMHRPTSDVDLRGVALPPARYLHGFARRFEQADTAAEVAVFAADLDAEERRAVEATKLEGSIYALAKFARLAADCNPNILDVLFCRDAEVRLTTPEGEVLREHRDAFLSVRARDAYTGYARQQLKRIEGHRAWLLEPPAGPPSRADFDLPEVSLLSADQRAAVEAAIRKQLSRWDIDYGELDGSQVTRIQERIARVLAEQQLTSDALWTGAARAVGLDDNLIAFMDRERRYRAARTRWRQYERWRTERNPERAALEAAHGFDTKHGAHLVRLLRMGREIVQTGRVNVWRGDIDADELLAIRGGAWSYEELMAHAERELQAIDAESKAPAVPRRPDREALDALVVRLTEARLARQ